MFFEKSHKIISIINQKGGVGKTVSTITLSSGLALAGRRVLVVDGDPQGNLTLFYTKTASRDMTNLLKDMAGKKNIHPQDYIICGVRENLDLIPMFNHRLRSEIPETELTEILPRFAEFLINLKGKYDWIFIDSSPSNGMLEKMLVCSCETAIAPLEFQLFSIAGLSALQDEILVCGNRMNRGIKLSMLIFTKAENRLNRINEYRKIFSTFRIPIFEIRKSEYLPRSIETGQTLWECAPDSLIAKDYYKIIEKAFTG